MKFSTEFAMPDRYTFKQRPIGHFLNRWLLPLGPRAVVIDPFCGTSKACTHCNDIATGGVDAVEFLTSLGNVKADAVIFDPPYSPRQISECYKAVGRRVGRSDTQNAALYRRVKALMSAMLSPGGLALSFGWQSAGFGRAWPTEEILVVQHGGAHNDTICVAQRKPCSQSDAKGVDP